jgi:hypothetical protein
MKSNLEIRISGFFRHSSFVIRHTNTNQCTRQKVAKKTPFSSRKTGLRTLPIYDTRENDLKTAWVSFGKIPKRLKTGCFYS